jgi:heat shock protein HslJ
MEPGASAARPRPMNRAHSLLFGFLICAVVVAGCATGGAPPSASPSPSQISLDGTTWRAVRIDGTAPVAGAAPTIRFRGNKAEGSDGCNGFGGTLEVDGGGFKVKDVAGTLIGCEEPVMAVAGKFLGILADVDRVAEVDGRLVLDGPAGELVLEPTAGL